MMTLTRPAPVKPAQSPAPPVRKSARRQTSSRRAILWGVAVYVLAQSSLNAAIQSGRLPVRDPIYFQKVAILQSRPEFWRDAGPPEGPRLLALGSSRTQLGLDAELFSDRFAAGGRPVAAFNFGCSAAGPVTALLNFRRLLAAGCRAEAVLIEIHPGFTSSVEPPYENRWLHPYRLAAGEADQLRRLGWPIAEPPQHTWRGHFAATYCYRAALSSAIDPKLLLCPYGLATGVNMDAFGFAAGVRLKPGERPFALKRAYDEYKPVFEGADAAGYRAGGPGVAALRAMLAIAQQQGMQAAVILMPESSEFRSWYGPGAGNVTLLAYGLSGEYSVPLIDARTWVGDEELVDGHHPTADGARQFTARLAADLLSMGWPPRPAAGVTPR